MTVEICHLTFLVEMGHEGSLKLFKITDLPMNKATFEGSILNYFLLSYIYLW